MKRTRILVVESEPSTNAAIVSPLEAAGFSVVSAFDGAAAGRAIDDGGLDFALADISAARLDDVDMVRQLVAARVPFVVLSANEDPVLLHRAVELGAMGYFLKPLDAALIVPSIRAWIARAAELKQLGAGPKSYLEALRNNRSIGTAIGMLMERHQLSADRAFETLRRQARSERLSVLRLATRIAARVADPSPPPA